MCLNLIKQQMFSGFFFVFHSRLTEVKQTLCIRMWLSMSVGGTERPIRHHGSHLGSCTSKKKSQNPSRQKHSKHNGRGSVSCCVCQQQLTHPRPLTPTPVPPPGPCLCANVSYLVLLTSFNLAEISKYARTHTSEKMAQANDRFSKQIYGMRRSVLCQLPSLFNLFFLFCCHQTAGYTDLFQGGVTV